MPAAVYMLASDRNGTIYIGQTRDLAKRIMQHKAEEIESFTKRYKVNKLVWYEYCDTVEQSREAETKIKNRGRAFKIKLVERDNPYWNDLSDGVIG